ncbi:MAG TPA: cache domain-containing protein [Mycobacteriales bacterium]|nr:cache domain-containing protein [Mycobacteriales bacterium]
MAGLRGATDRLQTAVSAIDATATPVFDLLDDIRNAALAAYTHSPRFDVEALTPLREIAQRALLGNAGWIAGTGYIAEIDALTDQPRWLEWWMARPHAPQPLRVDLDPRLPGFYDYTTAEWFQVPKLSGATSVAGPYVDIRGTNEYTVTVSIAIRTDSKFLGVAAADLYLSGLERKLWPTLRQVAQPAALTNAEGRVIVSTDWRLLPGELLPCRNSPSARRCENFPWEVLVTTSC